VEGADHGVLKEAHEVRLGCLLDGEDGQALKADLSIKPGLARDGVVGGLPDQALEGQLAQELRGGARAGGDRGEG
jgi:hypothetical protein